MDENHDWPCFYSVLCERGPGLLIGVDDIVRDYIIRDTAIKSDSYWSESLQDALSE